MGPAELRWSLRRAAAWGNPREVRKNLLVQRGVALGHVRPVPSRIRRVRFAAASVVRPHRRDDGPVWAVTMVRNEVDVIEEVVRHLLDEGVDQVLAADHGSDDGTYELLQELAASLPVHVTRVSFAAYHQAQVVTLLSRAAARNGAAWVVPFDGDELWAAAIPEQRLVDVLRDADAEVVQAEWIEYVPLVESGASGAEPFARRHPFRLPAPDPEFGKVAFRANWLCFVPRGSHRVLLPSPTATEGLRVAHFRIRSAEQVHRKATDGRAAAAAAGSGGSPLWQDVGTGEVAATDVVAALVGRADLVHDPVAARQAARDRARRTASRP